MSKLSAYAVVELVHLIKRDKRINQIQLFESRYLAEAYLNKRYKELYGIMESGCGVLSFFLDNGRFDLVDMDGDKYEAILSEELVIRK
jgi:hypothetical protein